MDHRAAVREDAVMLPILNDAAESKTTVQPRVTIPATGGQIYKATLVSLLNEDPQLSHDRYDCLFLKSGE